MSIKNQSGFSMLEVLITLGISIIGLVGLASLQLQTTRAVSDTANRSHAIWIAEDLANRIDEDNTLWWGQGYYFSDRNDTTWTKDSSEGGGHLAYLDIHGDRNSIKGYQRNCSAGQCDGHRSDIWIYGDDNDVFSIQDTDGAKDLDIRIQICLS